MSGKAGGKSNSGGEPSAPPTRRLAHAASALKAWASSLAVSRGDLGRDAVAGIPGAVGSVPDGMAASVLVGVNPIHGLYASFAGPIFGGLTSSTRRSSERRFESCPLRCTDFVTVTAFFLHLASFRCPAAYPVACASPGARPAPCLFPPAPTQGVRPSPASVVTRP